MKDLQRFAMAFHLFGASSAPSLAPASVDLGKSSRVSKPFGLLEASRVVRDDDVGMDVLYRWDDIGRWDDMDVGIHINHIIPFFIFLHSVLPEELPV